MAIGTDRVRPYKAESPAQGGTQDDALSMSVPKPADPNEDAIEVAGIYLQDEADRDELVFIERDSGRMQFRDTENTTPVSLSTLVNKPTAACQILYSEDGITFEKIVPIVGTGILVNDDGIVVRKG